MDAASPTPPSYPFHIAKAYAAAAPVRPAAPTPHATRNGLTVRPSGDSVHITGPRRSPQLNANIDKLAAAKVTKAPDFAPAPPPSSGSPSLPMYRHPADKNSAATGVQLGRAIDFNA